MVGGLPLMADCSDCLTSTCLHFGGASCASHLSLGARRNPSGRLARSRRLARIHSMIVSARISKLLGIRNPSAFAVFRLIARLNLVARTMGSSAGFAPLKILAT